MRKQSIVLALLLVGILLIIFWLPANRALFSKGEVRAALDIGSGATSLKIAKVDPKTNKIVTKIFEKSIPVAYQKQLEQSPDENFNAEIKEQGIEAIKMLKEMADSYQVKKVVAVATAAFRQAKNAQQFAAEIEQETGIPVYIITQDEEGILAFRGALALSSIAPADAVVWDIGGGSMQLTTLSQEGTYLVEKGQTASIPFKNAVIEQIKHQNLQQTVSPNPLSTQQMQAAVAYAGHLAQSTHPFIQAKIQHPRTHILAVGSLFNYGIGPFVKSSVVQPEKLKQAIWKDANKTDAELPGGSLVEVYLANPLLVLGYMERLSMKEVTILQVNNTDGALTYPPYWQE